jgi:phage baseplate assembly protein W
MANRSVQYSDLDNQIRQADDGDIRIVENARAIEQSFINILMTQKGERVLRPEFGTELRRAVFDLNDQVSDAFIRTQVRSAEEQETRIRVRDINVQSNRTNKKVSIVWGSPVLNERQMTSILV